MARFQRNGCVIAADRDRANVGARRQRRVVAVAALADHRYASRLQRVRRERRHVTADRPA